MKQASNSVKYDRVFSLPDEEKNKSKRKSKKNVDDEDSKHFNHSKESQGSDINRRNSNVELRHVKFSNIYETDKDNNDDEDIDFQGLGLRKYLESKNIISVMKPDSNPDKIGKKSKLDYVKEIAYFNQELNKLDWKDIIKESNKRLAKREIKEKAREEVYK